MTVRLAEAADVEAITGLINAAFQVEKFFIDGDRVDLTQVREFFRQGEFLTAVDEGGLAGCVYVETRGERGYFGLLSVDPARQGSGVGRVLVTAAEAWCRERGCRFMDLRIVNLREELPAFYRRLGYAEAGTEPFTAGAPARLACHFVRMSKAL